MYLAFSNGFTKNIIISNPGVTNANEGDVAQFLFVARAMLAGFNCFNVDLKSSRYDAVIVITDKILRVLVKGISNNSIGLKIVTEVGKAITLIVIITKVKLVLQKILIYR